MYSSRLTVLSCFKHAASKLAITPSIALCLMFVQYVVTGALFIWF